MDRKEAFKVKLTYVSAIPLGPWFSKPTNAAQESVVHKIVQCVNTIFIHAMSNNWIAVENDPSTFFLKENVMSELISRERGDRGRPLFNDYYVSCCICPFESFGFLG